MFKVKATVIGFLGNEEKHPCHFNHNIGDEFVFDGEKFLGRICPHALPMLIPKFLALYAAGPRSVQPEYYFPFWYGPPGSVRDKSMKKYDGVGWKIIKEKIVEPPFSLSCLQPPDAFQYPPSEERTVLKDITVICPDIRTAVLYKLEAFDLSEYGDSICYFRKQMLILEIVQTNSGIDINKIKDKFSREQREEVYPPAAPIMIKILVEELEIVGYLEIRDGKAHITKKGQNKLEDFKATLSQEERRALAL
jgi:uncharacterized repeat protein (TIGR04076 family)